MGAPGKPTRKKPASADAGAVLVLWPQFIAGRVRHNRAWIDALDTSEGEIAFHANMVKAIVDEVEATKITSERTAKRLQRRLAVADQHRDMVARLQQSLPIVRERDRLRIDVVRLKPKGKPKGAIGATQKALRDLLNEHPDADTHMAELHLKRTLPDHGLKRDSIKTALSQSRKALGITKS